MGGIRRGNTLFDNVPALGMLKAQGAGVAKLVPVADEGLSGRGFELAPGLTRLGRDERNDIVLADPRISRAHCELINEGGRITLRDLGSGNGTFINAQRVEGQQVVRLGDEIWLSKAHIYRLVMDEEMAPAIAMEAFSLDDSSASIETADAQTLARQEGSAPADLSQAEAHVASHLEPSLEHLKHQRDVLALLYQLSLRCLLAADHRETEKLLTNVLRRLAPMDGGFIVYRSGETFRVAIVAGLRCPAADLVRRLTRFGLEQAGPALADERIFPALAGHAKQALIAPMSLDVSPQGIICCLSDQPDVYDEDTVDILVQVTTIAAAALIGGSAAS
ncbi:MAG: FHA domain-containing protein [Deltaproteobacteria bacterium]|nr:FHA domain-containing protein [Deltaproteobacteria bacterium]